MAGLVHVDGSIPRLVLWPGSTNFLDGEGPGVTRIDTVAGEAELADAVLPVVPAAVLARTPGRWDTRLPDPAIDQLWQDAQVGLARQLGAPLIVANDSGHEMPREAPALVAAAIDAVVRAVRDQAGAVALDPDRVGSVGGRIVVTDPG
ncbi:MAG TPA: hypothetical protein VJT31_17515 [Rugosimonospora sp.]|nr:hypothetical protein [Rugosimonospora sp.]